MRTRDEQLEYEIKHDTEAATKRLKELIDSALKGDTELPRASKLIVGMYGIVESELRKIIDNPHPGRGAKYVKWLKALPTDMAALMAIRTCIQYCTTGENNAAFVVELASKLGKAWELEVRIREAEAVNPMYMQKIHTQVKERCTTNEGHLRAVYNVAYDRIMKGEIDSKLMHSDIVHLGKFGVDACMKAGLIEIIRYTNANGMANAMILTPEAMEFLTGYNEKDVALVTNKQHLTMLCPPEDWSTAQDGGFISLRRKFVAPLLDIRRMRAEHRLGIREYFTAENVPQVFRVANYLQSIPYEVHMPTVKAIQKVWAAGGGAMGVPLRNGPRKPECPMPEDWKPREAPEEEVLTFTQWKRDMVLYYMNHREWKGKVRELGSFVHAVELHDGPMWFPIQIDRRCRWYYRGSPNPQGSDLSKAVLRFTNKKPLGTDGVFWLKVHIANSLGFDKERFTVRARFTEDRWDALSAALDDPEANPDVWGTDAPWVAFSAAWELREAIRSGHPESYESGLIVHMDATCSGLQHFSAMLRDPIGGRYVNLVDELQCGPKQDIYARVGQNTMAAIKLDAENSDNPEIQHIAKWWLDVGISRTMAKKPVMTYVYGATLRGTARYIEEVIAQDMPHVVYPDPNRSFMYCSYCARKIFEGIEATVPAAASAMRWLKSIARQMSNKPLKWKTATGFQVVHDYPQYNLKRVTLHSCGVNMVTVKEIQKGTNSVHMQNAIAPNLVHAQDAAHMTMVADCMREAGMSLSGVHDSFGTHACDVRSMHKIIREQFVKLYESKNTLAEFLWDVGGVGEVPSRGTLDIRGILDSEFAFS